MRVLLSFIVLLALVACTEQRLSPQAVQNIRSLLLVVEPFDEVAVKTRTTATTYQTLDLYNARTKRFEPVRTSQTTSSRGSGTSSFMADLDVRGRIREVLDTQLSGRYRIVPDDRRVPALTKDLGRSGLTTEGPARLVADALKAAIPAGIADAILVVRGPAASVDYSFWSDDRLDRTRSAFIQADYDFFLIDGRTFAVLAAIGPSFKPDRRSDAPAMLRPSPGKYLAPPHGYRIVRGEAAEEDMESLRQTVLETIDGTVPLQLVYIGLIPAPAGS